MADTQKHAIEVMSVKDDEKEKVMEEKFKASERFKVNVAEESGRERRGGDRDERKRDFKDSVGLKPTTISVNSSPEDVEIWAANAKLYANASKLNVLRNEDQKVLLCSILERDLYRSLNLTAGDNFVQGVDKVKEVFDGRCSIFMRRVDFMKEKRQPGETKSALCRRLAYLGTLANIEGISGKDILMIRFTASCDDKVLRRDIFMIKEMTWESMIEAVNTHEAASRMESVTTVGDKLYKMKISETRNPSTSTPTPGGTTPGNALRQPQPRGQPLETEDPQGTGTEDPQGKGTGDSQGTGTEDSQGTGTERQHPTA